MYVLLQHTHIISRASVTHLNVFYSKYVSSVKTNVNVHDDNIYIFSVDICIPECSAMENDEPEEVSPTCLTPLNSYDESEANYDILGEPDISGDESEL